MSILRHVFMTAFLIPGKIHRQSPHRPETCGTKEPGCRVHGSHHSAIDLLVVHCFQSTLGLEACERSQACERSLLRTILREKGS